jgi:hypothetical protein
MPSPRPGALMTEDTPQRTPSLYDVFNGLCWLVRASTPWRMVPHDLLLTPVNAQDRAQVVQLAAQVQEVTDSSMVRCVYAHTELGVGRAIASRDTKRG